MAEGVSLESGACDYDVKHLQMKITEGKLALLRFQKLIGIPHGCGPPNLPGIRETARPITPYRPHVQGFWYEPNGNSSVIIDGNMVQMGQYLPDRISRVISITRDTVVIKRGSKKFVLHLDNYGNSEEEKSEK